jgi:methionine sulfoxide reductase heme-binding subunit
MGHRYWHIQWTPYKKRYDAAVAVCLVAYLAVFYLASRLVWGGAHQLSDEIILMRATATAAALMLHIALSLGPLARLDRRFLPLLYNRRHLGVATFVVAAAHGAIAIGYYHGFGTVNPLLSLVTSNTQIRSISSFPFEWFGVLALVILLVMAFTSHDFWLEKLSSPLWKRLHMLVYIAWLAVVVHVALGAMQSEHSIMYPVLLGVGAVWLGAIHILAGTREARREVIRPRGDGWIDVGRVEEIPDAGAATVSLPGGGRVAVFRYDDKLSAVTDACAHQGGPLGEGRIVDGCITCPWHGFTYRPQDGCAPAPFTEKLATYALRVEAGRVYVSDSPFAPGTPVEPVQLQEVPHAVA